MSVDRPTVLAALMIAFWATVLATGLAAPNGWITNSQGTAVEGDYIGVYTAGKFALQGEPLAAYDWERHETAQRQLDGNPHGGFFPWPYPPTFLLIAAALATLPYYYSMLTWALGTLALATAAIARITTSRRDTLLMLATPALWLNLYIGQNGALTAALVGFGLVLLPTCPIAAGACIGLLSIKPHLGLLIPIALLAGGHYRAFASAALTAAALALTSVAVFGAAPWLALPDQLQRVGTAAMTTISTAKIQSAFGMARSLGASIDQSLWLQGVIAAALVVTIAWLWRRRDVAFELKAAALAAAATLATPYQFVYDLALLTIAQAFLLRSLAHTEADTIEIYGLIAANVLVFLFAKTPLPLGFLASVIVFAIILRRVQINGRLKRVAALSAGGCPCASHPSAGA